MKRHHYSQHAASFRAELGAAIPRDAVARAARARGLAPLLVAGGSSPSLPPARGPGDLHLAVWCGCRWRSIQGFTVFNFTVLLHEVVHHAVFERRRPALERLLGFCTPCRAGSRPPSSRGGTWTTTRNWGRRRTTRNGTTCRRRSMRAGTSCSTARPRCFRSTSGRRAGNRRLIPSTVQARGSRASAGCRSAAHLARWPRSGAASAPRRRCARTSCRCSSCSPSPSRSTASGSTTTSTPTIPAKWTTLVRGHVVLGRRVPQLELSPRAPLLPGGAVLPAARAAAGADAVLQRPGHALALVRRLLSTAGSSRTGAAHATGARAAGRGAGLWTSR